MSLDLMANNPMSIDRTGYMDHECLHQIRDALPATIPSVLARLILFMHRALSCMPGWAAINKRCLSGPAMGAGVLDTDR